VKVRTDRDRWERIHTSDVVTHQNNLGLLKPQPVIDVSSIYRSSNSSVDESANSCFNQETFQQTRQYDFSIRAGLACVVRLGLM
jgi:hypothetical protein